MSQESLESKVYIAYFVTNAFMAIVLMFKPELLANLFVQVPLIENSFTSTLCLDLLRFMGASFFLLLAFLSFFLITVTERRSRNVFNLSIFTTSAAMVRKYSNSYTFCRAFAGYTLRYVCTGNFLQQQTLAYHSEHRWKFSSRIVGMSYFILTQLLFGYLWFQGAHGKAKVLSHQSRSSNQTTATTTMYEQASSYDNDPFMRRHKME